ncbi:DUF4173 domain-containing protein [Paenibacillus doosanensis]|uniref:DUF4153 domain-containing protein n=1 Tax=Paenibacillus doosanensis TaxID=1229154 RepID=UPI00218010F0|nr:DUF4173 domain-containing protein [Paenibacillus doosanensis]MCS7463259.1 DUF4173 domain-containing protein [Paenibacillus doosanensis]
MASDKPSYRRETTVLGAAILLGVIHQGLFYGRDWGLSYPLFTLCFYLFYYWAIRERERFRLNSSLLLLAPVVLLSLTYALFTNLLFMILNALAIPCLLIVHTTWTVRGREMSTMNAGAVILSLLEQLFVHSLRYAPLPGKLASRLIAGRLRAERYRQLWKVLAGLVISLPILLLVGALLASADTMFDRTISGLPRLLSGIPVGEAVIRTGWVVVAGGAMFVYVWGLLYPKEKPPAEEGRTALALRHEEGGWEPGAAVSGPAEPVRMDPTITATLLLVLNAVYMLFAVLQFSYFFGGGAAALPEGVTYAEYARRGFAELVIVTLINFALLMLTLHGVERTSRMMNRSLRVLAAMLIGCTGVMLCSAYFRLSLYEMAYGYSITRILVHAFMLFLVVLFALALYKVWNERFRLFRPYAIVSIAAYVLINYIQVDAVVASSNLERYEKTGSIDAAYLGTLSYEAVPYLVELERRDPNMREAAEALDRVEERLTRESSPSWTEFNWSKWKASRALGSR